MANGWVTKARSQSIPFELFMDPLYNLTPTHTHKKIPVCARTCSSVPFERARAMLETLLREMDEEGGGDDSAETVVHDNEQVCRMSCQRF